MKPVNTLSVISSNSTEDEHCIPDQLAELVHKKSVEVLNEVGFCVPERDVLSSLSKEGFIVDYETQMVRIPFELVNQALETLPKDVKLYHRNSVETPISNLQSCFMGAGTPVHVFDLKTERDDNAFLNH